MLFRSHRGASGDVTGAGIPAGESNFVANAPLSDRLARVSATLGCSRARGIGCCINFMKAMFFMKRIKGQTAAVSRQFFCMQDVGNTAVFCVKGGAFGGGVDEQLKGLL